MYTGTLIKARATHMAGEHSTTEPHPLTKDWGPGTQRKQSWSQSARTVLWGNSDKEQSKKQGGPSRQTGLQSPV